MGICDEQPGKTPDAGNPDAVSCVSLWPRYTWGFFHLTIWLNLETTDRQSKVIYRKCCRNFKSDCNQTTHDIICLKGRTVVVTKLGLTMVLNVLKMCIRWQDVVQNVLHSILQQTLANCLKQNYAITNAAVIIRIILQPVWLSTSKVCFILSICYYCKVQELA